MSINNCCVPCEKPDLEDDRWMSIHKRFLQDCLEKDPEIVFIGDDILEGLVSTEMYRSFEEMHVLNFSIRGDLIENILWRIEQGEIEKVKPKIIVLNCGTNNTPTNSAEEISEGIMHCVQEIRKRRAGSFIILLTLLPRGHKPNPLREKIDTVNKIIQEKCHGLQKVQIIDISKGLVQNDGTISHHDLYDYLNLTNAASKKLFEPVLDVLNQILNENEKELLTPSE
ncbi:platelet-activating factor acetylhydrolase IB subunit beta homolog [Chironomus tepperi]|uniref:platelet-activating factor acetylhydrolase IB subunit beta homolog n=1 Tax=Chironomus tepperi TaxID=113505 RepID=UPI00391FAEE9